MAIYEKPTKELMKEFAAEKLQKGQSFTRQDAMSWFAQHYPKINSNTVSMHVNGMSVNSNLRKHHPNIHPESGHNLFYKIGKGIYRLWEPETDPAPMYKDDFIINDKNKISSTEDEVDSDSDGDDFVSSGEFAYEKDLKNYLVKNLSHIEQGLTLYEEEGFSGVEYPVGGRLVDILAVDKDGCFVVIELKVSRGYDRVIGQLLRYMSWIEQNLSEGKPVRGIIIASNISEDLKLACSLIKNVSLYEYEISMTLNQIPIK